MKIEDQLQIAILTKNITQTKSILNEIEQSFIQVNVYNALNMATLHSNPEIIELLLRHFEFDLTDNILIQTLNHINNGSEKSFENYKAFINSALKEISSHLLEDEIVSFCLKDSKNKYELMYKEEFLKVLNKNHYKNKINITDDLLETFETHIKKEQSRLKIRDF